MNQLETIQTLKPTEIYSTEKVDKILSAISEEARAFKADISTPAGRKEIASFAYKIARSKTFMDECGKKLGEEAKKTLDIINAERKKIRDTLDALNEEVRKPLTDWEKADEARKAKHQGALIQLNKSSQDIAAAWQNFTLQQYDEFLAILQADKLKDWEEYKEDFDTLIVAAEDRITLSRERKVQFDKDQEELAKLRAEKEARDKAEAERLEQERIKEQERLNAEAAAREEERKKQEAAQAEAKRLENEKRIAEEKEMAIRREKDLAEKRLKEAEEKAAREKEEAVLRERKRIDDERKAAEEAEQKRQANLKHRTKINNEVLAALKLVGLDDDMGKKVITAIVSGHVPHTKIVY